MVTRAQRGRELMALFSSPVGRNQLLGVLRQYMNVPTGQVLPVGTPIIETILDHEFAGEQSKVSSEAMPHREGTQDESH